MKNFSSFGFYVLRRPLLPVDAIFTFLDRHHSDAEVEVRIKEFFREPYLQEAIYLASPELFARLERWLAGEPVSEKSRLVRSLFKYLVRAGVRCTPYGLFAGCTDPGSFGAATRIAFRGAEPYARLDMHCLAHIADFVGRQPHVRDQLTFRPNGSLYAIGNEYRYTYYEMEGQARNYSVCSVEASEYLVQLLQRAAGGATPAGLARSMVAPGISLPEAEAFVNQLIDEQLLTSQLQVNLTGPPYADVLAESLSRLDGTAGYVSCLKAIEELLRRPEDPVGNYRKVAELVRDHFSKPSLSDTVQVDVRFPTDANTIGQGVLDRLTVLLGKLEVLHQGNHNQNLDHFRSRFYDRYEEREVPLLVALDGETGIGYGEGAECQAGSLPLIEHLNLTRTHKGTPIEWSAWKDFILRKYSEALLHQQAEITLTDEDLAALAADPAAPPLPGSSFAAFGNLLAGSAEAADRGDFLFNLYAVTGPSAVNFLGRFCHANPALAGQVQACLQLEEEQSPGVIFAEIVHLPEDRMGNILCRPAFRKYEIPYLAQPAVDEPHQIPLADIMVSVRDGREIVLRSRKLNKVIIPRLGTAHNYKRGLTLYRFLCDLQFQQYSPNIFWHWSILEKQTFLPRVRYQNVILSRATWNLCLHDYPQLNAGKGAHAFGPVRERLRLPRYVVIAESDNELLLDLDNAYCQQLLVDTLVKKELVALKEFLQVPGQCLLRGATGQYTNEIVIPFRKSTPPVPAALRGARQEPRHVQRSFLPCSSEWLYLKIYCGEKTADALLSEVIGPCAGRLVAEGTIDQWFFIRYADPDAHLRVRFRGDPQTEFYTRVLREINGALGPYVGNERVSKVKVDTYQREVERYGSLAMEASEEVFFHDSRAVVAFLNLWDGEPDEQYRWLFGVMSVDSLLDDFSLRPPARKELLEKLYQHYYAEFGKSPDLKYQLDRQYQKDAPAIRQFLVPGGHAPEEKAAFAAILAERSRFNRVVAGHLPGEAGALPESAGGLLTSYIHMSLNRLFLSNQRAHELVVYYYLYKHYKSRIAREEAAEKMLSGPVNS